MVTSTLQLTDEQHDCVTFDRRHDLLIKGPAGSGKTIVLLLRGAELHKAQGGSVRFLTFANALAANAEHVSAQVLVPQAQSERPAISSYHSWCAQRLARLGIHHTVVEA